MAWGDKVAAKDILGMETEEFHAKLNKIDEYETKFKALEDAQRTSTSTILERMEALKPAPPPKETVDPDVAFLANPSNAIDERLKPLSQGLLDNSIMLMHRQARETYPKDFERWGTEITQKMGELSANQQADPRVWKACVMMVRGEHAADLEKDGAQGKYSFLEPVSAGLRPDPKTADGLSDDQRKMVRHLRNLGPKEMTPEKYQAGVHRLRVSRNARMGSFGEGR